MPRDLDVARRRWVHVDHLALVQAGKDVELAGAFKADHQFGQRAAEGFGVIDQGCQLAVHFLGDAGFQHPDLQPECARHPHRYGLPPLDHFQQITQRLDHPAQRADGAFVGMDEKRRFNRRTFDLLAPAVVPAVHRPCPRQLVQQVRRAGFRVVQGANRNRRVVINRRFDGPLQRGAVERQQAHPAPPWITL